MKIVYTVLVLLFITNGSFAQKWGVAYGSWDYESCRDVVESYDKGYLLVSYSPDVEGFWLLKTDINGELLWDKKYTWPDKSFSPFAVDQNNSGEILITGWINYTPSKQWPMLIKLDSCGNKQWCRVYFDYNYNSGNFLDAILYESGDALVLTKMPSPDYTDQVFLWYIDTNGNVLWRQVYASKTDHPEVMVMSVKKLHQVNDEYMLTGDCYYPHPDFPQTGYYRPFFISIDSLYEEKWILPFGVEDWLIGWAYDVIALNEKVYMGVGCRWESGLRVSTYMFFNEDGQELGYNDILNESIGPGLSYNAAIEVARINDSLFLVSSVIGSTQSNTFMLAEFIVDTSITIHKQISHPNIEGNPTLVKTFDDKYVIGSSYVFGNNSDIYLYKINDSLQSDTIYPGNFIYDSLCSYSIESETIDVSNCVLITDVGETPTPKEYFKGLKSVPVKAYPNPSYEGWVSFELLNTDQHKKMQLHCFNIFGQQVHKEKLYPHQGESRIDVSKWSPGIYLAVVYAEGMPVGRTKFVIQ